MTHPKIRATGANGKTGGTVLVEPLDRVRTHYQRHEADSPIIERVRALLDGLGQGPQALAAIAALDHFHVRGRAATLELAALAGVARGMSVLDAGSGLGGPSRTLASTFDVNVTGIDLTPAFVAAATLIAELAGLGGKVRYAVGNLLDLDFELARFDLVWSEHVVMNITDRERLYAGFARVLKPRGVFAFYDVMAVEGAPSPHFPNPWAEAPETSFLFTSDETAAALGRAGFSAPSFYDASKQAIAWFAEARPPEPGAPSLAMVMGPRFPEMVATLARNVREGRVRLVMGVARTGESK